jgi:hypothetical protein
MSRDLRLRIAKAVAGHVDPALFEQCVWDLLLTVYPGLAPIPGGHDFGRDADVHGPSNSGRLIATTAVDVRRNLVGSMKRLARANLASDHIILATTQSLSARRQRSLTKVALEMGARRLDIYERESWISRLYHDPGWRFRLLGLRGEPAALVDVPLELDLSGGMAIPLLGRENEVERLLGEPGDWLVVGVAGSGKTRLLAELPDVGFVIDGSISTIAEELRSGAPAFLVVDDADRRPGLLRDLAELRRVENLQFTLVATTWPAQAAALGDELVNSRHLELPLLERPAIDKIATGLGVENYYLRREILDQAEGRPGWAFALATLARGGGVQSLMSGRSLIEEVERFLRKIGLAESVGLLAHVAALRSIGPNDYGRLTGSLQMPRLAFETQLAQITRGGLVEASRGQLVVRPEALRRALVARWFFDGEIPRDIGDLLQTWEDRRSDVIRSTIEAADIGSRRAKAEVARLAGAGLLGSQNLAAAAGIDEEMAQLIVQSVPMAAMPQDVLEVAARRYALPDAIKGLMELGMSDERARHSHPDHPLRIVAEVGARLYPHGITSFDGRTRVLTAAVSWVREAIDSRAWDTFAEVANGVLNPQVEGSWAELAETNKFTMAAGFESPSNLHQIEFVLWPRVRALLAEMSDSAVSTLADSLDAWIRVARGYEGPFGTKPDPKAMAVARRVSRDMKARFAERAQERAGLTVRLQAVAKLLKSPIRLRPPAPEFAVLAEDHIGHRDWKRFQAKQMGDLRALASRWVNESAAEVVSRLSHWTAEALIARRPIDAAISLTITNVLGLGGHAGEWAEAVVEAQLCPGGSPAIERVLTEATVTPTWLTAAMSGKCRGSVIHAVLTNKPGIATDGVLAALTEGDADAVEWAVKMRITADETCRLLLTHQNPSLRGAAALGFRTPGGPKYGPEIPPEWEAAWVQAIIAVNMGMSSPHREFDLREVLEGLVSENPDVAEAWVRGALEKAEYAIAALPYNAEQFLHNLPRVNRDRLLRSASAPWDRAHLLTNLIGSDVDWAEALIAEEVVTPSDVLNALSGRTGPSLEVFLPLLLREGISPEAAASRAHLNRVWMGSESSQYRDLQGYFEKLATSDDTALAAVGVAGASLYQRYLEQTEQEEKVERIRGL